MIPYRGVVVPRIERSAAGDLYRVRSVLEGLACYEFTLRASQSQKDDLARILTELEGISGETAAKELLMKKSDYYECLLAGAGNKVLSEHFGLLNNRISQLRRLSLSRKGRLQKTVKELQAIINAINALDPLRARELAEKHVMHAAEAADQQFEELERLKKHLGS